MRHHVVAALIIAAFSLLSLTWFKGAYLMGVGDNYRALDRVEYLSTVNSAWRANENTGNPEFSLQHHFPFSFVYAPLSALGIDNFYIARIFMFLSVFLPALFMYFFLDVWFKKNVSTLFKILLGLFYVFNPIGILQPLGLSQTKFPVYVALPLILTLLVKLFEAPNLNKKISFGIFLAFSTTLAAASTKNIAETAPLFIIGFVLFTYLLIFCKNKFQNLAVFSFSIFLALWINFWWIYSSFFSQYGARETFAGAVAKFGGGGAKIFDALRLFGFWGLNASTKGVPYYPFGESYYKLPRVWITFLITTLTFAPLLFVNFSKKTFEYKSRILVFLFLAFLGIFLAKGSKYPLGEIYESLYNSFAYFRIFREPFAKFSLISLFSFTVLIAYSLDFITKGFNLIIGKLADFFIGVIFLLIMIYISVPMFNGQFVSTYTHGPLKQMIVKVPEYWYELNEYSINNPIDGRVLTLPKNSYYRKSFIWEKGFVGKPYELFFSGNTIWSNQTALNNKGDVIIEELYKSIQNYNAGNINNTARIQNLNRILNIQAYLQMNDFDYLTYGDEYKNWSNDKMQKFYNSNQNFFEDKQEFGKLSPQYLRSIEHISGGENIYRSETSPTTREYLNAYSNFAALSLNTVASDEFLPKVYVPNKFYKFSSFDEFMQIVSSKGLLDDKPLLSEEELSLKSFSQDSNVEFRKITDGKYKVKISNATNLPTVIVFSETFHPQWNLMRECNLIYCSSKIAAEHFEANYYANGWIVPSSEKEFYIVHQAEQRLHIGIIISMIGLLFSGVLLIFLGLRSKKSE